MNWSDIIPGDMITVGHVTNPVDSINVSDPSIFESFKYDVFFIIGIQQQENMVNVQMLLTTTTNGRSRSTFQRKHKMQRNEINSVFHVYRNGTLI